jgi:quercetin dioxygenase-like cupin family protein
MRTIAVLLMLVATPVLAQSALQPARLTPEELHWATTPTGTLRTNLGGDDKKAGLYLYRVKFPANFKNTPHFHPDDRVVTVMSGTLYVGYGERFEEKQMKALPAGSIWTEPAKQPHFVWAKDGEVVIQVSGVGPSGVTQVQPKP